jgi:poly(3-hydroxybutyrate) depolymerase
MRAAQLLVVFAVACNSAPSGEPSPAVKEGVAPAATTKGEVVHASFKSAALGVEKDVVVYLPAGYDAQPTKKWPVFYYLHGLTGNETNWTDRLQLDKAADGLGLGAILVMPDGDNSFYADSAAPADYDACIRDGTGLFVPDAPKKATCVRTPKYEEYIVKDLIAWVDATYRTNATKRGRAIAGLSMGGFGALQLAMRHPDLFAATASHSGVDALLYLGPDPYVAGRPSSATIRAKRRRIRSRSGSSAFSVPTSRTGARTTPRLSSRSWSRAHSRSTSIAEPRMTSGCTTARSTCTIYSSRRRSITRGTWGRVGTMVRSGEPARR